MAIFTVDLLSGNLYLFSGDFNGSGSTPTSGSTYTQVNLYSDLPSPVSASGQIYLVRTGSGTFGVNRKSSGLYFSIGSAWKYLADTPDFFKSNNFQVYDSVDNTKGIKFTTSGITSGIFRNIKFQNSDGIVAYLTDLNTKVDVSVFNGYNGTTAPLIYLTKTSFNTYTGTTAPSQFASKSFISTYTGTTVPNTYYNKTQINTYTGETAIVIGNKQNTLIAGIGIQISGDTINATTISDSNTTLQLLDTIGGVDVNGIITTPIIWTSQIFSGTSLSFTGGSRIYANVNGNYDVSYILNVGNNTGSGKNIGTLIRKNNNIDITPTSTVSFSQDSINNSGSNTMPQYLISLLNGDYIELMAFRIGDGGNAFTKENSSWIRIKKI